MSCVPLAETAVLSLVVSPAALAVFRVIGAMASPRFMTTVENKKRLKLRVENIRGAHWSTKITVTVIIVAAVVAIYYGIYSDSGMKAMMVAVTVVTVVVALVALSLLWGLITFLWMRLVFHSGPRGRLSFASAVKIPRSIVRTWSTCRDVCGSRTGERQRTLPGANNKNNHTFCVYFCSTCCGILWRMTWLGFVVPVSTCLEMASFFSCRFLAKRAACFFYYFEKKRKKQCQNNSTNHNASTSPSLFTHKRTCLSVLGLTPAPAQDPHPGSCWFEGSSASPLVWFKPSASLFICWNSLSSASASLANALSIILRCCSFAPPNKSNFPGNFLEVCSSGMKSRALSTLTCTSVSSYTEAKQTPPS